MWLSPPDRMDEIALANAQHVSPMTQLYRYDELRSLGFAAR